MRKAQFQRRDGRAGARGGHGKGPHHAAGMQDRKTCRAVQPSLGRLDAFPPAAGGPVPRLIHDACDPISSPLHAPIRVGIPPATLIERVPLHDQRKGRAARRRFLPRTDAGTRSGPQDMGKVAGDQLLRHRAGNLGQSVKDAHHRRGPQGGTVILWPAPLFKVGTAIRSKTRLFQPGIPMQGGQFRVWAQEFLMAGQGRGAKRVGPGTHAIRVRDRQGKPDELGNEAQPERPRGRIRRDGKRHRTQDDGGIADPVVEIIRLRVPVRDTL